MVQRAKPAALTAEEMEVEVITLKQEAADTEFHGQVRAPTDPKAPKDVQRIATATGAARLSGAACTTSCCVAGRSNGVRGPSWRLLHGGLEEHETPVHAGSDCWYQQCRPASGA